MATGFMASLAAVRAGRHFASRVVALCASLCLCWPLASAFGQEVGLAGLMGSKAMLVVNGGEPQIVAVGQLLDGVKLVAIRGEMAVVEVGGKQHQLRVGQNAVGRLAAKGAGNVTLQADGQGQFFTNGSINGAAVRFLVDTGATYVSLGIGDARRVGVDFARGEKVSIQTANGQAVASKVRLDSMRIGDIVLYNVDALIQMTEMPAVLLGMSFLNRMEMRREGGTMTLKKRF